MHASGSGEWDKGLKMARKKNDQSLNSRGDARLGSEVRLSDAAKGDALDFPCPTCKAAPGIACRNENGRQALAYCRSRMARANRRIKTRESATARGDRYEYSLSGLLEHAEQAKAAPSDSWERKGFADFAYGWLRSALGLLDEVESTADKRTTPPNLADKPNSNADEVYQRGLDIIRKEDA
jgi:hypothetical protein